METNIQAPSSSGSTWGSSTTMRRSLTTKSLRRMIALDPRVKPEDDEQRDAENKDEAGWVERHEGGLQCK